MPLTTGGGSKKPPKKPAPKQPSAKAISAKKGGNTAQAQKTTSGSSGDDKKTYLVSKKTVAPATGKRLTGATTFDSPKSPYAKGFNLHKKLEAQRDKSAAKIAANRKEGSRESNADRHGFTRPKASGGTATGGGGSVGGRVGSDRKDPGGIPESGANDGGRLSNTFRDGDLVGSDNQIDDFGGGSFSGGGNEGGGGGGSGSALAGRESSGLADVSRGESMEDVVYGVKKRRGKVRKARGE